MTLFAPQIVFGGFEQISFSHEALSFLLSFLIKSIELLKFRAIQQVKDLIKPTGSDQPES